MKSPVLLKLIKSVLIAACIATSFSGCVTSIPQFASYRPPNSDANFGIEVHPILSGMGVCEALELRINGEVIAVSRGRMRLTTIDFPTVKGIYKGKQIRMDIQYLGQRVFMQAGIVILVDVFVGDERACRLTVEIK